VKRKPEPEDAALFREAMRDVKPLQSEGALYRSRKPPPRARFTRADRRAVLEESLQSVVDDPTLASGEELAFRRGGVQDSVMRKLRRGHYRVQAEIDLHGLTVPEAKAVLREFLAQAVSQGMRCVRIIHGKGLRSGHRGPVLKSAVSSVLRRTASVIAFVSARPVDGGTGALYALLSA
jgi:DNA-nicking Smr family endonuclease